MARLYADEDFRDSCQPLPVRNGEASGDPELPGFVLDLRSAWEP
jgi:hypothetical protein